MKEDRQKRREQAEALYAASNWADAEPAFAALREEGPEDGNLIHDHAVCLFQLGRQMEALRELDRAVELEPDHPYRYASRAWIRAALKDVDGAIADYRKALELDPDDAIALNNLGLLEEQYGMRKSAQERYRKADTLMGILREAGIDPPATEEDTASNRKSGGQADGTEAGHEKKIPPRGSRPTSIWKEVASVFTDRQQRQAFLAFIRNGFRT